MRRFKGEVDLNDLPLDEAVKVIEALRVFERLSRDGFIEFKFEEDSVRESVEEASPAPEQQFIYPTFESRLKPGLADRIKAYFSVPRGWVTARDVSRALDEQSGRVSSYLNYQVRTGHIERKPISSDQSEEAHGSVQYVYRAKGDKTDTLNAEVEIPQTPTYKKILRILQQEQRWFTSAEIARALGITPIQATSHLCKLRTARIIEDRPDPNRSMAGIRSRRLQFRYKEKVPVS